jgi:hypothetical protein
LAGFRFAAALAFAGFRLAGFRFAGFRFAGFRLATVLAFAVVRLAFLAVRLRAGLALAAVRRVFRFAGDLFAVRFLAEALRAVVRFLARATTSPPFRANKNGTRMVPF